MAVIIARTAHPVEFVDYRAEMSESAVEGIARVGQRVRDISQLRLWLAENALDASSVVPRGLDSRSI
jgi:hypothetical protein